MLNKIKLILDKYIYFISILIYVALNFALMQNNPISDDIHHIFNHRFVFEPSHPFVYFNPLSEYFKSWGFTYFYLWFATKLFGSHYFLYRTVNFILHMTISYLTSTLITEKRYRKLVYLFLLFHPLSVLTTSWIFQFKTLSAVLFLILFLKKYKSIENWQWKHMTLLLFYFYLSITSKIIAILFPFYLLVNLKENLKNNKIITLISIMFLLSLVYGVLNIKGITYIAKEVQNIQKDISEPIANPTITPKELEKIKVNDESRNPITIYKEINKGLPNYFQSISGHENIRDKYIISLQNLSRSIYSIIGLNNFYPFYENNIKTLTSKFIFINVVVATILIFISIYFRIQFSILFLLIFIPISGIFYVPYMKYSYLSDHWNYPLLIPFALILSRINKLRVLKLIIIICFSNYLFTVTKYYSTNDLFTNNYLSTKNKIALEEVQRITNKLPFKNFTMMYDFILSNEDFYNEKYYLKFINYAKSENVIPLTNNHFYRIGANIIRSNDDKKLEDFIQYHQYIFSKKHLNTLGALISAETQSISEQNYKYLEDFFIH